MTPGKELQTFAYGNAFELLQLPGELAAQYNPVLQGWWNYYGAFYPTALGTMARYLDAILMRWARDKNRTLRNSRSRSALWLERIKRSYPQLFVHWRMSAETVR